jgi:hypothetical protein
MRDTRTKLIAVLTRVGALDLAGHVWTVRDVRALPANVKSAILDVLGNEAALRGLDDDGRVNNPLRRWSERAS